MKYAIMTPRLRLYAPSAAEIDALMRGERQALGASIGVSIPDAWPGLELLSALPVITAEMARESGDARWMWMIIEQASSTVVGDVGFHGPLYEGDAAEIGYALLPDARGKGYATEAAEAVIRWAFANMGVRRIFAQIDPSNTASLRVAAKLGMQPQEALPGHYLCFGIGREQR